jgi:prepilin-type N-terminal cleavage/methylation domain-containing protein
MIRRIVRLLSNRQLGFTLIELLVAAALTSIIGFGAATATFQVVTQNQRNNLYTTASRNTMNAIHWISRDAQMTQTVTPDSGATGFPLTLSWVEWDNSVHQIIYSISGDTIRRSYSVNGGDPEEVMIAQYINSTGLNTMCELNGDVLTIKVTATVGQGGHAVTVSKVREITPRPSL